MCAAVYHGPNDIRVDDIPVPEIADNEIMIRVMNANICGTDLRILHGGHRMYPQGTIRVPGHEVVGEIAQAGRAVRKHRLGERVFIAPNMGESDSRETISGNNNLDPNFTAIGINVDGAFAEYMRVPAEAIQQGNVMPVRADLDPAVAALIEPLACVLRGQNAVDVRSGDTVVVMGAGPIGILHMMLAQARGAVTVVVSEPVDHRRLRAGSLGAEVVVDPVNQDLGDIVRGLSGGRGADVIIVAAPSKPAQVSALGIAAIGGRINFFGGLPKDDPFIRFNSNTVHYRELVVTGTTACSTMNCVQAAELVNGSVLELAPIITSRFPLNQAPAAFAAAGDGTNLRVTLEP